MRRSLLGVLVLVVGAIDGGAPGTTAAGDAAGGAAPVAASPGEPVAVPAEVRALAVPRTLVCRGNEPFWSLRIDGDRAVMDRLGLPATTLRGVRTEAAAARPPTVVWRGRPPQAAADLVAVITGETCQDTMADITFPLRTLLSTAGGEVLTGCCEAAVAEAHSEPAATAAGRRAGWWETIPATLAAIDTCLAAADGAVAVSGMQRNAEGLLTIRMTGRETRRFRCRLDAGSKVLEVEWSSSGEIWQAGETRVLFTRAPHAPPAGGCFSHDRVTRPDGTLLGWLSRDTC